jgi:hypothetical protein
MKIKHTLLAAAAALLLLQGCNETDNTLQDGVVSVTDEGYTNVNATQLDSALNAIPAGDLSQVEADALLYMREEEKLAHDVYVFLYSVWNQKVFNNIAKSEQTHPSQAIAKLSPFSVSRLEPQRI